MKTSKSLDKSTEKAGHDGASRAGPARTQPASLDPPAYGISWVDALPKGGGASLDARVARGVERATGQVLGDVRVYTDRASEAVAAVLGARAFTLGTSIYLGRSASPTDSRLMSHEAAHTLQQRDAVVAQPSLEDRGLRISKAGDALEREADGVARAALSGGAAQVTVGGASAMIQRKEAPHDSKHDYEEYKRFEQYIDDYKNKPWHYVEVVAEMAKLEWKTLKNVVSMLSVTNLEMLWSIIPGYRGDANYTRVFLAVALTRPGLDFFRDYLVNLGEYGWPKSNDEINDIATFVTRTEPVELRNILINQIVASMRGIDSKWEFDSFSVLRRIINFTRMSSNISPIVAEQLLSQLTGREIMVPREFWLIILDDIGALLSKTPNLTLKTLNVYLKQNGITFKKARVVYEHVLGPIPPHVHQLRQLQAMVHQKLASGQT